MKFWLTFSCYFVLKAYLFNLHIDVDDLKKFFIANLFTILANHAVWSFWHAHAQMFLTSIILNALAAIHFNVLPAPCLQVVADNYVTV